MHILLLLFISVLSAPVNVQKLGLFLALPQIIDAGPTPGTTVKGVGLIPQPVLNPISKVVPEGDLGKLVQEVVTLPSVTLPFKKLGDVIINSRPIGEGFFGKIFLIDAKVGFRKESVVVKIPKFVPSLETQLKKDNGIKITQPRHEINVLKKMGLHVDDMVIDDGRIIIAMKLAKGTNLRSFIREIKTKEDLHQLRIAANKALKDMHSRGVIHNDLHSGNMMVERNTGKGNPFTVRIIDFGMADIVPRFERSNMMGLIDSMDLELIFERIARDLNIELT